MKADPLEPIEHVWCICEKTQLSPAPLPVSITWRGLHQSLAEVAERGATICHEMLCI